VSIASAIGLIGIVGDVPSRPQGFADGRGLSLGEGGVILPQSDDGRQDYIIHFSGFSGGVHG
jgi:hypothetical protein